MLEHVMGRGAKVDQEPVHYSRLTMQSDAETMPDPAAATIAADEIVAAHLLRRPIGHAKGRRHALRILRQLLECHVPPRLDPGERFHRALQHWLDLHL